MPIIKAADKIKRNDMNEMNLFLSESLAEFLMGFKDEVVKAFMDNSLLLE